MPMVEADSVIDTECGQAVARDGGIQGEIAVCGNTVMTSRNLSGMQPDQCYNVPITDGNGGMHNDPVAIKHSNKRWWILIAGSDLLLWVKGLAIGAGLDRRLEPPRVFRRLQLLIRMKPQ